MKELWWGIWRKPHGTEKMGNSHNSDHHQNPQNDAASSENPQSEGSVKHQSPEPPPPPPAPSSAIGDELAHDRNQKRQPGEDGDDHDLGCQKALYEEIHQVVYRESLNEAVMNLTLEERSGNGGNGGNEESSNFDGEGGKNEIEEAWEGSDGDGGRVENEGDMEGQYGNDGVEDEDEEEEGTHEAEEFIGGNRNFRTMQNQFPLRIDAEDCAFYMKTGNCKFEMNCKFNHPKRRHQGIRDRMTPGAEDSDRLTQTECKYYLTSGGCKFGNACKFNHSRDKSAALPIVQFNFMGLPIRLGEKECPYYMRTGSCKYGSNCKFNHPDPISAAGNDQASGYSSIGSVKLHSATQSTASFLSSSSMMFPQNQGIPLNPDHNGYQIEAMSYSTSETSLPTPPAFAMNNPVAENTYVAPHLRQMAVDEFPQQPGQPECSFYLRTGDCKYKASCRYHHPKLQSPMSTPCALNDKGLPLRPIETMSYSTSETSLPTPPAFAMNNPATENKYFAPHPQQMPVDEFPQRPGQPECSFYLRTGDCKYKASCIYHHPKLQSPMPTPCALSDKGLPLRPDQSICSYYNCYGICKFGPACKFDHPENWGQPLSSDGIRMPGIEMEASFS